MSCLFATLGEAIGEMQHEVFWECIAAGSSSTSEYFRPLSLKAPFSPSHTIYVHSLLTLKGERPTEH